MADDCALGHRHPDVRRLRELLRDPAARREDARFVLEGPRLVGDALARGIPLDAVYLGPGGRRAFADLARLVSASGCSVHELKEGVLEKVGSTRTPQPVLAVCAIPAPVSVGAIPPGLVVMTVGIQDPGNLGTIVRSAEAAGATAVIAADGVDPWNPKAVRGAAGSMLGVRLLVTEDAAGTIGELRTRGARVVATDSAGTVDHTAADLSGFVVLVVGGEARGIGESVQVLTDLAVRIPMHGAVESLNAGVAASIVMFEAARQAHR